MFLKTKVIKSGRKVALLIGVLGVVCLWHSCWYYKFSGTSIPSSVQTVSIAYFDNKAQLVNPALSNLLTEKLKDKYRKMTRLEFVDEEGDFSFEGEITGYENTTMGYTADEVGALNRLTITVKIYFKSVAKSFDQSYSKYRDYPSEKSLDEVESQLVDEITEDLIEDIFNATAADW